MTTTIDGSASVTINSGAILGITSGTAQASTSGTSIDFTGIPSWVKRITVMFNGVSTSGTSSVQVQLGISTGPIITGYLSNASNVTGGGSSTTGMIVYGQAASDTRTGLLTIVTLGSNLWVSSGVWFSNPTAVNSNWSGSGTVTLSSTLDRVRITTVNGTDTFDAGSINILYE